MAEPRSELQTIRRWHDRISTAKKYRDRCAEQNGWERIIREYNNKYEVTLGTRRGRIPVPPFNEVFSYVQTDIATMSFKDPYITINPKKNGTIEGAAILETGISYYWRTLRCKDEIDSEMIDTDLVGHGWNKDGYFAESIGDDDPATIKNEGMYSMKVSWRDIVFNIGAMRPPMDCVWMAHRIVKPLSEIKKKYPGTGSLKGSTHPRLSETDYKDTLFKDDIEIGILQEIWDAEKHEFFLLAEGHDKYLVKPKPWPSYYKEFPFTMLWYYEKPDEAYPMSPIAPWEPQILETNKLFAQALNHVKRWNRQMFYRANSISDEDMDKFEEGNDGAAIPVQGQTQTLQDMLKFADYGSLPTDIYMLLDRLAQQKREVNGMPEFSRGAVTKTNTRTLGELEQIATGAKTRVDKRVDRLETHMEMIARHMIGHMQANFDVEQMVKITGEPPEEIIKALGPHFDPLTKSVIFSRADIPGEYDVDVKAGSTLPLNKSSRLAILRDVLEIALKAPGPLPFFAQTVITELLRDYELPQLQVAFQKDQQMAQQAQQQQNSIGDFEKMKVAADAEKRKAQAEQIHLENVGAELALVNPNESAGGQ